MKDGRPKLRLVNDADEDIEGLWDDDGDDPLLNEPAPRAKAPRLPRSKREFAIVPLQWLLNRRWDDIFPTRVRLYLYLQYRSHRGAEEVRLTNREAAKLGLGTKQEKMRVLRLLEDRGLITVMPTGPRTVCVTVARQRHLPR
jgi:hypothetical protein